MPTIPASVFEPTQEELAALQMTAQLTALREQCDGLFNLVDMSDSFSFDKDDGTVSTWRFDFKTAYSQGLIRPSATACAYLNEQQLRMLRAASRAFAISNPYWMAVKQNRISYGVGCGHVYTVLPRLEKEADDELSEKVVDEINNFCKVNKYRRRQNEKLTRLDRDGEYFLRLHDNRDDGILRVRFVEPLLIQTPPGLGPNDGVWFGIKFDGNDYEEPLGYFVRPANYEGGDLTGEQREEWSTMVPAEKIQHGKANVDMSSPRGLPTTYALMDRMIQALKTATTMGRLVDYRGKVALIRKRINAVLSTISPILNRNRTGTAQGPGGVLRNIYQLPDAAVVDTNDQATYEFPSQNIETDKIVHSIKADLQAVSAALGIADFMLSADSAGGSFAIGLAKEGPVEKSVKVLQQDLIDDDLEVFEAHLNLASEKKRLPSGVLDKVKIDVQPPVVIERNRIQDTQADELLVRNGAMSPETMAMRANLDFADEKVRRKANPPPMDAVGNGDQRSNQAPKSGKATGRPFSPGQEPGPKANPQKASEEFLEHASDARSKDKPTSEDEAMAATLITPEWLEKTKQEILALPKTVRPIDAASVGSEYELGVKGMYLGVVDEQQVWAVDFDAMMVKHGAPDLITAGNHMRWDFIPADKIVVDWSFSAIDKAHNLLHEVVETRLSSLGKWAYARAHRYSNMIEDAWLLDLRPELRALCPQE